MCDFCRSSTKLLWGFYGGFSENLPDSLRRPGRPRASRIRVFSQVFPGLFRAVSQTFVEDSPRFCRGLPNPGGSHRAWPDGQVNTYAQDAGALRGFCGAFEGNLPGFAARMQGFYRTPDSDTLHRQIRIRGLALGICVGFARGLHGFCRGFPGNLLEFCGRATEFW